jgi:PIN domain nuclease of toxin-antitoxin system
MKYLIDTHLLLWAATDKLPKKAVPYFSDKENILLFSSASIWEIIIKKGLNRPDFQVDPAALYWGLLDNGYMEITITSQHTLSVADLPPVHKDPFDRILIAQARAEDAVLLSSDKVLSQYSPVTYIAP